MRPLVAILAAALLSGCALPGQDGATTTTKPPTVISPAPEGPPIVFGGVVRDELTNATPAGATVRIDLAQTRACGREGIVWTAWGADVDNATGRFGPLSVPRPRSNDVAFFVHAGAEGYEDRSTFIGPTQARGDTGNLSLAIRPSAALAGTAPPGTLVAIADDPFPLVAVAGADGRFVISGAPVRDASFVAATDEPFLLAGAHAPGVVNVSAGNASGWRFEARLVTESGAPIGGDVVAWNGTQLAGVARAGDAGVLVLQLPSHSEALRIEARTSDGHYGATLAQDVQGPPATRATIVMRALC